MKEQQINARFWVYENGADVQITLRPGQRVQFVTGGPTDEGFSWTETTLRFDGHTVRRETYTSSSDCDGPHEHWFVTTCNLLDLRSHTYDGAEHRYPLWETVSASQRDHFAEAMGY